ncbi:hypothetical protein GCM10008066_06570 [Oxalicibacterium faecigallinarum]|uniref:Uncharacterized protein n=1 Tax=Oxalicibacterium faecigallinarum TaxID=573741 RepID=A0A8J3AQP2_9BURK|nr:hypothetical protein GCM10008066_06570 [Oxalicibacterium faecigallinarum]
MYANRDGITLAPAQRRGWQRTVDSCRHTRLACEINGQFVDDKVELGTAQNRRGTLADFSFASEHVKNRDGKASHHTAGDKALDKTPPTQTGRWDDER